MDRRELERLLSHPEWQAKYSEFMPRVWAKMRELRVRDGVRDAVPWVRSLPGVLAVKYRTPAPTPGWSVKFQDGTSVIWLDASIRGSRHEQFVCCHEAAHHLFHPPGMYVVCEGDRDKEQIYEIQANWAASELKMPSWRLRRLAVQWEFNVHRLAREFNLSREVVSYRVGALVRRLRRKGALPNRCPKC
ncbi:MAG: ImmA/IrrE family metallo-endopeptidase, partial [Candidatus Bipolaricaulota bacterium]